MIKASVDKPLPLTVYNYKSMTTRYETNVTHLAARERYVCGEGYRCTVPQGAVYCLGRMRSVDSDFVFRVLKRTLLFLERTGKG